MEEEMTLAEDFLRTMIHFLENGTVENLVEGEVINYFRMCKQIEIYNEKFKFKGYYMSMDVNTGVFSLSRSEVNRTKYDLNKLADKLFTMFCHPNTPPSLLSKAVVVYMNDFGKGRLGRCVAEISGLKPVFCVETTINRASQYNYNFDATLIMEGYMTIASKPRGMARVKDMIMELIIEDECAETVVSMFTVEDEFDPRTCLDIKKILLERLKEKFEKFPHSGLWLRMVTCITVISSINAFEPFLEFILNLVKHLSSSITCLDSDTKKFSSPPGSITYDSLVHVITKFYRNKRSCQKIINFIFNQCGANPAVWYSVLDSCHNIPSEAGPALPYYDYSIPDISSIRSLEWKK